MVTNIVDVKESQIAPYSPPRAEIREMLERFKSGLPNADKLSDNELRALATFALAHSLNPWNQEVWAIPGKGLMPGIKGLRKVADRAAEKGGFRWWTEFFPIRNTEEATNYGIPENAVAAFICVLRRSDNTEAYMRTMKELASMGIDYDTAMKAGLISRPPQYVGVGYALPNEDSRMPVGQRVMKRAEAHAIKQAFSMPFTNEYDVSLEPIGPTDGSDGDWVVGSAAEIQPPAVQINEDGEPVIDGEPEQPPTPTQTFPFAPDKRLCDFDSHDWQSFWPFMQKHTGKSQKESSAIVHDALQVASAKESQATFSQCLDAVDQHMGRAT